MSYSIEELKGLFSGSGGIARTNRYRIVIPTEGLDFDTSYISGNNLDLLCKSTSMPGRQMLTFDRMVGPFLEKVAYGYAVDDVTMTFIGLNDYAVRRFFGDWHNYIFDQESGVLKYKDSYTTDITIASLTQNTDTISESNYKIKLYDAFPTQLLNVELSNDLNATVDISATFSYTRWNQI